MKFYNARVRLDGAITNEVNVGPVTAAEIVVLQRIHGADGVQNIVEMGNFKGRSDAKERARLAVMYPKGPSADGKSRLEGPTFIASVFGVSGVALPAEYVAPPAEVEEEVIENEPDVVEEIETLPQPIVIKRTVVASKKPGGGEGVAAELIA